MALVYSLWPRWEERQYQLVHPYQQQQVANLEKLKIQQALQRTRVFQLSQPGAQS